MLLDLTQSLLVLAAFSDNLVLGANIASAGLAWPNDLWVPMAGSTSPNTPSQRTTTGHLGPSFPRRSIHRSSTCPSTSFQ